jgi:hypothetical protein
VSRELMVPNVSSLPGAPTKLLTTSAVPSADAETPTVTMIRRPGARRRGSNGEPAGDDGRREVDEVDVTGSAADGRKPYQKPQEVRGSDED